MATPFSLLIIGNDSTAEIIRKGLEDLNIKIKTEFLRSGKKALPVIESGEYDLIISEYKTRDLSRSDLVESLKEKCRNIPLAIIADPEDEKDILKDLYSGTEFGLVPSDPEHIAGKIKDKIIALLDQKNAREENTKSDRLVKEILDSASYIGIITTDENKIITFFNKGAEKILGYGQEELVGKETPMIFHIEEEISKKAKELSEKTGKSIEGLDLFTEKTEQKGLERHEWTYKRKDGNLINVELTVTPIRDDEGNLQGAFGIFYDITDKKRLEEEFKIYKIQSSGIITNIPNPTFAIDRQGKVTAWNRAIEDLTGIPAQEILGKGDYEYAIPFYGKRRSMLIDLIGAPGEVLKKSEYKDIIKTGNVISVEARPFEIRGKTYIVRASASPIYDGNGKVIGSIESISDLTHIKNIESALRESEAKTEYIIDSLPGVFYIFSANGEMIRWNKNFETLSGYTAEEIKEMKALEFIEEQYRKQVSDAIKTAFTEGYAEIEGALVAKDGKIIPIFYSAYSKVIDNVPYLLGTGLDITDRKRAEEALAQEKANVEYIIDSLPGMFYMFYMFDEKGRFVRWNKNMETLTGYSEDEISKMKPLEFIEESHRDAVAGAIKKAFSEGYSDLEAVIVTKDGRKIPFFFSANMKLIDEVPHILGMGLDITKTKETEAEIRKLASVVRHSGELISLANNEGIITFINEAGAKMIGARVDEIPGYHYMDFIPDYLKEKINSEIFPKMFKEGQWEGDLQYKNIKTGDIIDVHTMAFTINDPETEEPVYLANVSLNISDRKKAEAALKEVNKKLNLLGSITRHDILNQITVAQGYIEILEMDGLIKENTEIGEYCAKVASAVETIRRQITFTKDYKDLGEQSPEWYKVGEIIDDNYRNSRFQVIKLVNETKGLEVYADPLFEKVIYNLFDNAVKHGEKITTIKFGFKESGDDMDLICEDDGAGVPDDVKEKIFKRQYYKHTGLGLFLSREILSITGLSIEENGRYGEGAKFVIHIPKGLFRFPG